MIKGFTKGRGSYSFKGCEWLGGGMQTFNIKMGRGKKVTAELISYLLEVRFSDPDDLLYCEDGDIEVVEVVRCDEAG